MKNLVFNLRTAKAQAEGCAKVSRMAKVLTTLTLLLTLGVGQAWGDAFWPYAGFYEVYMTYSYSGNNSNYTFYSGDNNSSQSVDLGTLTADFKVNDLYLKCYKNTNDWEKSGNICGALMMYNTGSGDNEYQPAWSGYDTDKGWSNTYQAHLRELSKTGCNKVIASYNTGASGSYTAQLSFKMWGSDDNGSDCGDIWWISNNSNNYKFTYKIAPPAVSGFGVTTSGYLAGSGTSEDPYLVKSGESLTFTVSGTQAHPDDNSTFNYWLNPNAKQTFGTLSTGSITSTDIQSAVVHGQYINNSTSSLVGTESTSTIYYKAVSVKNISVYIYVGGCTDVQINSLVLTANPYVGSKAVPAVNIPAASFTTDGDWRKYTFTNVSEVRNVVVAREGGRAVDNITITDDIYYKFDGTNLGGKCVPPAYPTWGTAPKNGAIGGSMTASVSGAPAGATITWSSTNENTASVNSSGVISYKAPGNTTIKANVTWIESGDYCAGSYELSQEISVTSGAMVSVERTCAAYVATGVAGQVSAHITFTGTSSGWKYRIKQGWSTGYETGWLDASGTSADWTMTGGMDAGERTYTVELYTTEGAATPVSTANFSVTGELAYNTTIAAGANGSVSPSGTVYANNNHVHPTITATPNEHYHFENWTSNNAAASVADAKSATTTVTATASGYTITANFAGDEYTITYKDQGDVDYSGNNEGSLPATHTYGTATDLVNGTKDGYAFKGWYMTPVCTGEAVTSLGATAYTNDITLYAKWGKNPSLTRLDLSTSVVTTGNTFTATPTIDAGDGRTTNVCWAVKNSSDEEVSTTITPIGGNAVTITAPAAPGKYKVVATLREGKGCEGTVLNSLQQSFSVEGHYTVTITNGTGSENVGEETTATVTANAAEAGMKFDHWTVEGTYTLQGGTSLTSREIQFTASTDISITAVYTERDSKTVYFAKPADWDHVYAYAWNGGTNNKWPGVQLDGSVAGTGTVTVNCATYYYYKFYTDAGSDDAVATVPAAVWTNVIFNSGVASGSAVANNTKTSDLTIVNGNYYGIHTGMQGTLASGYSTSAKWTLRGSFNGWSEKTHPFSCADDAHTYSVSVTGLTASTSYDFKIWGPDGVAYKYTGGKNATYNDPYDITSLLDGRDLILNEYSSQNNTFTAATTSYTFTIDVTDPKHPVLTVISGDEANYSATLQAGAHGDVTNAGAVTLHRYATTSITATPEPGYRFLNWTSTGGGTVEFGNANNATTTVTATADGATITANFTNEGIIYLDKSAISSKWSGTPYVYFYSGEYWNNVSGSGSQTSPSEGVPGTCISASNAMTRIGESQIWYYDYSALLSAGTSKQYIAFVDKSNQTGKNWFDACSVIYRGDFYPGASMFVVRDYTVYKNKHGNVQTAYYNEGYWRKYNDTDPGYVLKIYNGTGGGSTKIGYAKFASEEPGNNTCTAKIHLSSDPKGFKVEGCDTTTINGVRYAGTWYSNSGKMTSANSSNWEFVTSVSNNCGITPTAEGDYIFTLSLADGRLYVSVEYPLANNDYRIVYNGKVKTTGDATHHPSNFIRNTSNGGVGKDTVSFFVTDDGEGDPDWSLTLQQCTNASANPVQWANACDAGHTLTASDLELSGKTGVYVFEIEQNSSGSCSGVTIRNLGEYTGNYYIRTDVADGGWEAYETVPDNKMIFSEYARDHSGFDYYHCHWTPTNTNVKFTIANDYSACITDTVENDTYVTEYGKLPYQANIRFMYNSAKNTISRAYLNGSSETGENTFLYLQSTSNASEPDIYQSDGSELVDNTIRFNDHNNWIYQIDIQANEQARVKLISNYRFNSTDHLQYFKGTDGDWSEATTSEIIGGDYSSHPNERHALRIIYDFKTNHLLSAWLVPESGSVPAAAINTNVMIIKQNQEDARQITFSSGNDALTEVDTVYTAVLLTKDFLTGGVASEYAKQFYWVSFPYTVQINDIFGSVGTYGYDWILQRYNGKKRAANGFWIDSEPNWEFMDKSETLNPYEGYILTLDLSEFTTASNKWGNSVTTLSLYFPSDSKVGNIKQKDVTVEYDQTGYACTITRDNRNIKDSYWRCIGSPSFAENTIGGWNRHENTDDTWKTENLPFLYEWNSATNQLSPVAAGGNYTFKPLTGYMVQYSGASLNWTNVVTPSVSAPKRQNSAATDLTYKLQLVRGEEEVDHTFVRFSDDENITAAFEFNQDLSKEFKSGANIYTLTSDQIQVAGNSLPLSTTQTTVVPVGVKIKTAGDYTFSIPEGTDGIGVTLVDNETGVRTLLSALDYTVNLAAGDYTERFWLEISPIQNTPTGIEEPTSDSSLKGRAQKRIIDGVLYIVKDGKIFDARGARVE